MHTLQAILRPLTLSAHCLCALAFFWAAPMCAAATYYVSNSNGNDSGPGTQSTPFLTIQQGIVSSASGDTVVVEAGTYTGPRNVDIDLDGRNITLTTDTGDPTKTIIDCMGSSSTYHRGFYLHNGEGAHGTLTINGFTVKNGYEGNGNNNTKGGGGIYIASSDTVTLLNCAFTSNTATGLNGGGMDNEGTVTLTNCQFRSNITDSTGAGAYNKGTITQMTNCTCDSNVANQSGGGLGSSGTVTVTGCKFTNNTASSYFARGGGGAYSSGAMVVQTSTFSGNTATNAGGGLSNDTGILTLMSCTFSGNTATQGYGGGLDNNAGGNSGALSVTNCVFAGNKAPNSYGGGISLNQYFTSNDTATIANCLIVSNTAGTTGGGVDNNAGVLTLEFSTLSGNVASGIGGGVYNSSATSTLTDDILYNDNGGEAVDGINGKTASVTATYCDILGGYAGTGVFDKNPKFVNPNNGDYHLQAGSPCVGVGTLISGITTDLEGKTRANPPSIGAYEGATVIVTLGGHTHLLWNNTDGRVMLWSIAQDGTFTLNGFGPYTDGAPQNKWTATAVATGADGVSHLLWNNTDGRVMLWTVDDAGNFTLAGYGPYTDGAAQNKWSATAVSVGPDGTVHLLWNNTDHRVMLWSVAPDFSFSLAGYGPYTDNAPGNLWSATALATGPDDVSHILWNNTDNRVMLWNVAPSFSFALAGYGPYTDGAPQNLWSASALSVGPDNVQHILWTNTDRRAMFWNVDSSFNFTLAGFGPYTDNAPGNLWSASAVATGPDGLSHLLWDNPDNRAMLWGVDSAFGFTVAGYGPYTDNAPGNLWSATAVSAGP